MDWCTPKMVGDPHFGASLLPPVPRPHHHLSSQVIFCGRCMEVADDGGGGEDAHALVCVCRGLKEVCGAISNGICA